MTSNNKKSYLVPFGVVFVALPLLLWRLGDFPQRTVLKETLSVITLLAFFLMLAEFFLARSGKSLLKELHLSRAVKIHKFIGYTAALVILVHPFLIVVPRYYEAGVEPMEALETIITTFDTPGIMLGIIAWCLMLILALTSLVRKLLPIKYKAWRLCHGLSAIAFVTIATWHAVDLGRHTNGPISIAMIILAGVGVLLLLKTYIMDSFKKTVEK